MKFIGTEYKFDLEAALQMAIKELPSHLISADRRRLVGATSCWDDIEKRQVWILRWLNKKQLSLRRFPKHSSKGGGDMTVKVTSDGAVTFEFAR